MLELIKQYFTLIVSAFSLVVSLTYFVIVSIRTIRARKYKHSVNDTEDCITTLETQLSNASNIYRVMTDMLPKAIKLAEENVGITGASKKLIAISNIIQQCAVEGINYQTIAQEVDVKLEELIDLTKKVN